MATSASTLPLGVCVVPAPPDNAARTVSYPEYVHEILDHAGVCYTRISLDELDADLPKLRLLVTVGDIKFSDTLQQRLKDWVDAGGAWIAVSGVCGMAEWFGVEVEPPAFSGWGGLVGTLGEGYLTPKASAHPIVAHAAIPLHFFNGVPVHATSANVIAGVVDAHQRPSARTAVTELAHGKGRCLLIAPDLTGAVVHIQQGRAVTRDRGPAHDGTAPCCDNVLKSDDGSVLDWIFDRQPVPGVPGFSAFLQPVADQWRELLLRAIFHAATEQNVSLPVLWLYPRNAPALGHISHDTDLSEPGPARTLLDRVREAGIHTTWCTILPAYEPELMRAIKDAGHEYATHYDAMSEGRVWSEDEFDAQWRELTAAFGGEKPVTNKNHYLRWEGDTEFFEWLVKRGIQLDQSKGPSKTGEAGFNFGTCHPYFPVTPRGERIDVLELATMTQDMVIYAPPALIDPVLDAVVRCHGVMHFLFHPAHIQKPGVADAFHLTVNKGKERGLEWWTASQINAWERARRRVRWTGHSAGPSCRVTLESGAELPGATILWLGNAIKGVAVDGIAMPSQTTQRWGFSWQAVGVTIRQGKACTVECQS
ncbi:MAG: hypothetical protein HZB26_02900 [Candidatus Hydrogenedentes bacterium]|nr:hypothetical protein [Candidatus Hydrogenedentota bacterium]